MSALGGWRFSSVNVVFDDAKGDFGLSITGAIPIRSPLEPQAGAAAMDGTAARKRLLDGARAGNPGGPQPPHGSASRSTGSGCLAG
jgi:hypothetical protein